MTTGSVKKKYIYLIVWQLNATYKKASPKWDVWAVYKKKRNALKKLRALKLKYGRKIRLRIEKLEQIDNTTGE